MIQVPLPNRYIGKESYDYKKPTWEKDVPFVGEEQRMAQKSKRSKVEMSS